MICEQRIRIPGYFESQKELLDITTPDAGLQIIADQYKKSLLYG